MNRTRLVQLVSVWTRMSDVKSGNRTRIRLAPSVFTIASSLANTFSKVVRTSSNSWNTPKRWRHITFNVSPAMMSQGEKQHQTCTFLAWRANVVYPLTSLPLTLRWPGNFLTCDTKGEGAVSSRHELDSYSWLLACYPALLLMSVVNTTNAKHPA